MACFADINVSQSSVFTARVSSKCSAIGRVRPSVRLFPASPQQIAVMELQGYSWSTCSKQPRFVDCRTACRQQARPSTTTTTTTSFVDNAIDLPRQNFLCPEFGTKCQREVPLFLKIPKYSYNTVWDSGRKPPCQNPTRFVQSFRYNTGLWQTDRRTDRRRQQILRYHSVAR